MKIGIVVPFSWSFWGGVPEHADHQARALAARGHEVKIVMGHDPPGRLTKALHPRAGRHERPPPYVIPVGRSVIVPANGSLSNIVLTPRSLGRIRTALARERFDVLHLHEPLTPVICVYALAAADCPVVSTSHAAGDSLRWYPMGKVVWGFLAERIDRKIAVSARAREVAARFLGGPVEVIPNGVVVPPSLGGYERVPHVVFIGRNDPRKGLPVLLRAWPSVVRRTGARLRVVGADPLSVRWLVRRGGYETDNVDLLGSLPEEALTDELLRAQLLVAPSVGRESFGMVLTRAFGCGTPVVASDIDGYRDVAGPETGILVPPGDVDALARGLVELLTDDERRRALGEAARRVAEERYSWSRIARRLDEVYGAVAGAPAAPRIAA
ncbi:MAG: glycosyltransferase family 4 protein [Thermoleophilia bacterium]|nr:glycosyltransferase family 4 protein [Thermoleophilia bacterium]